MLSSFYVRELEFRLSGNSLTGKKKLAGKTTSTLRFVGPCAMNGSTALSFRGYCLFAILDSWSPWQCAAFAKQRMTPKQETDGILLSLFAKRSKSSKLKIVVRDTT